MCVCVCVCVCVQSNLNVASEALGLVFPMQQDRKRPALLNCVPPSEHSSTHSTRPITSSVCVFVNLTFCVYLLYTEYSMGLEFQPKVNKKMISQFIKNNFDNQRII